MNFDMNNISNIQELAARVFQIHPEFIFVIPDMNKKSYYYTTMDNGRELIYIADNKKGLCRQLDIDSDTIKISYADIVLCFSHTPDEPDYTLDFINISNNASMNFCREGYLMCMRHVSSVIKQYKEGKGD